MSAVIQKQKEFFEAVFYCLKELEAEAEKNQDVDLVYAGAKKAFLIGKGALDKLEEYVNRADPVVACKKLVALAIEGALPSHIYQRAWRKQEIAMLQMASTTMDRSFNANQFEKAIAAILVFEYPLKPAEEKSVLWPVLAGVAGGFYAGKNIDLGELGF